MRRAALLCFVVACGGSVEPSGRAAGSASASAGASSSGFGGGGGGVAGTAGNAGTAGEGRGGATSGPGGTGGKVAVCGDGSIDPGEACDDGNDVNGDACSDACAITIIEVTPSGTIAEWPDVAATSHDGGKGFLLAWRGFTTVLAGIAAPIGATGAMGAETPLIDAEGLLTIGALPSGEAVVLQSACNGGLCAASIDPSTLAASATLSLDLPEVGYARVPVRGDAAGRVGFAFPGAWDAGQGQKPLVGCVADPDFACATMGASVVEKGDGAVVVLGDQFAFVTSAPAGFAITLFDGMGSLGSLPSIDEPSDPPLSFDVAPRPGGFVAAWNSSSSQGCVHARLLDEDLSPLAPSFEIEGSCPDAPLQPRVATGPAGRFVVAYWSIEGPGLTKCGVHARVFEADGTPAGPVFEVSEHPGCNGDVRVAANPDGDVLFVWNRDEVGTDEIEAKLLPRLVE